MLGFEMETLKHRQITFMHTMRNDRKFICSAVYNFSFLPICQNKTLISLFLYSYMQLKKKNQKDQLGSRTLNP